MNVDEINQDALDLLRREFMRLIPWWHHYTYTEWEFRRWIKQLDEVEFDEIVKGDE